MPSEQKSKGTKVLERRGPPSYFCPPATQVFSFKATTVTQFHPKTIYVEAEI